MAEQTLFTEAFVLGKKLTGESLLQIEIFSQQTGKCVCIKRLSSKLSKKTQPDLFDKADLALTSNAGSSGIYFIREYKLLKRYTDIGKSYKALEMASFFAKTLLKNLEHVESFDHLYTLCNQALSAWASGKPPEATLLKCLYKIAQVEGYPVRQDWLQNLSIENQAILNSVIQSPLDAITTPPSKIDYLIKRFMQWLESETPIYC